MDKTIKLRADIEIGVCPTHVKFVGGLVPGDDGKLPRDENGELFALAEMRTLTERSPVAIDVVQISQFNVAGTSSFRSLGIGLVSPQVL